MMAYLVTPVVSFGVAAPGEVTCIPRESRLVANELGGSGNCNGSDELRQAVRRCAY